MEEDLDQNFIEDCLSFTFEIRVMTTATVLFFETPNDVNNNDISSGRKYFVA